MTEPSRPLTIRLRTHLPRASALAIAARQRDTTRGKASITDILNGLEPDQLRDLAVVLAMYVDTEALIGESLVGPLDPVELAMRAAARRFNVTEAAMRGPGRQKEVVDARHVASYVAHRLFNIRSTEVGRMLNRDHSTILYACGRVGETPRLRRVALDIAVRVGWQRPDTESPEVVAS